MSLLAALLSFALAPSFAAEGPHTVAVLYFENQGNPALEPLKVGLADMMVTDLHGTPSIEVVERSRLQEVLNELDLGHTGKVDPATANKLGQLLGAQWFVMGTYFELGGTLRLDARLVEVQTGKILYSEGKNGPSATVFDLERQLAESLRKQLVANAGGGSGKGPAPKKTRGGQDAADHVVDPPSSADVAVVAPDQEALSAAVAYSEGLIHLDEKDVPRAREAFQRALTDDPSLDAARQQLASLEM